MPTVSFSTAFAFLISTKFNKRSGGAVIDNPAFRQQFQIPGVPSDDPTDPVPSSLSPKDSAAIARLWKSVSGLPMEKRMDMLSDGEGSAAGRAAWKSWFRRLVRKINMAVDAQLDDQCPTLVMTTITLHDDAPPDPNQDPAIFFTPELLDWPYSSFRIAAGSMKLAEAFGDHLGKEGAAMNDLAAEAALQRVVQGVWERHRKSWQRARAKVFGQKSSNATVASKVLWPDLLKVMEGERLFGRYAGKLHQYVI